MICFVNTERFKKELGKVYKQKNDPNRIIFYYGLLSTTGQWFEVVTLEWAPLLANGYEPCRLETFDSAVFLE